MFHRVKSEAPAEQDKVQTFTAPVITREENEPKIKAVATPTQPESREAPKRFEAPVAAEPAKPVETARPRTQGGAFHSYNKEEAAQKSQPSYKSQSYLQISNTKEDKKTMLEQNTVEKEQNARVNNESPASIYQRGPAASASPASYNPSVYTSPYAQKPSAPVTAAEAASNDRKLTIGRGITMSGEIEACDHLYVEGTVEAALKGAKVLDIAETGVFYGTVEINDATISGRFEGELVVNGRLTVESTGVITGSISYGELQVESGAIIDGRMTPVAAAKSSAKAPSSRQEQSRSDNSSRALFEDRDAFAAAE